MSWYVRLANLTGKVGSHNLSSCVLLTSLVKLHVKFLLSQMAHPRANGFFGASFPAGGIPHAYTLIARKFFDAVTASGHRDRIKLHEYRRDGWTFHGKGLWYSPPGEERPIATLIGELFAL